MHNALRILGIILKKCVTLHRHSELLMYALHFFLKTIYKSDINPDEAFFDSSNWLINLNIINNNMNILLNDILQFYKYLQHHCECIPPISSIFLSPLYSTACRVSLLPLPVLSGSDWMVAGFCQLKWAAPSGSRPRSLPSRPSVGHKQNKWVKNCLSWRYITFISTNVVKTGS